MEGEHLTPKLVEGLFHYEDVIREHEYLVDYVENVLKLPFEMDIHESQIKYFKVRWTPWFNSNRIHRFSSLNGEGDFVINSSSYYKWQRKHYLKLEHTCKVTVTDQRAFELATISWLRQKIGLPPLQKTYKLTWPVPMLQIFKRVGQYFITRQAAETKDG